jgi:hypothetical protein
VSFRKPLFLPSTVTLSTAQSAGGWEFGWLPHLFRTSGASVFVTIGLHPTSF